MTDLYVAILVSDDKSNITPIVSSNSLKSIKIELDEYFNITTNYKKLDLPKNKCLGFTYKNFNVPTNYEGFYIYEEKGINNEKKFTKVNVYRMKHTLNTDMVNNA